MAEENKEELELSEVENSDTEKNSDSENNTPEQENSTDANNENQDFAKAKKSNKLKLILFSVIGLLSFILVVGIILYFIGFFDEKPVEEINQTSKQTKNITNQKQVEQEEYKFSLDNVNTNNLNKELLKLTNKTILDNKEKEKLENEKKSLEEEKKKYQEKLAEEEKKLAEEKEILNTKKEQLEKQKEELENLKKQANTLKEEMLREKEILEVEREKLILSQLEIENTIKQEENKKELEKNTTSNSTKDSSSNISMQNENSEFILLINVAKIKGELYKDYLDKVLNIYNDVLLCRDDFNNIEIYYGPFNNKDRRSDIYAKMISKDFENSYEVELTKDEFNKRCKY